MKAADLRPGMWVKDGDLSLKVAGVSKGLVPGHIHIDFSDGSFAELLPADEVQKA